MRTLLWLGPAVVSIGLVPVSLCAQSRWIEVAEVVSERVFLDTSVVVRADGHFEVTRLWHYDGLPENWTIERADVDCANRMVRTRYREMVEHVGLPVDVPSDAEASARRIEPGTREWLAYPPGSLGRIALDGTCTALESMG